MQFINKLLKKRYKNQIIKVSKIQNYFIEDLVYLNICYIIAKLSILL